MNIIPLDSYLKIGNANKQMCALARVYYTTAPDGPECRTAQALWSR